ncbi:MAG: hypothetical protein AB9919_13255 [Geobacteraceae bacterium]
MYFNFGKNIVVKEEDPHIISSAVRVAFKETTDVLISEYGNINGDLQWVNEALIIPENVILCKSYVEALWRISTETYNDNLNKALLDEVLFSNKLAQRCTQRYLLKYSQALKLAILSLHRQQVVVVPMDIQKAIPCSQHNKKRKMPLGIEYYSKPLQSALSMLYPLDDPLKVSEKTTIKQYARESADGPGRYLPVDCCAIIVSTNLFSFNQPDKLDSKKLEGDLIKLNTIYQSGAISYYLTILALNTDSILDVRKLYELIQSLPNITIRTSDFAIFADRKKKERYEKRKIEQKQKLAILGKGSLTDSDTAKNFILEGINASTINEKYNDDVFIEYLCSKPIRRSILSPLDFPDKTILPDCIDFKWGENTSNWIFAWAVFLDIQKYESVKSEIHIITTFQMYLFIYLPVWLNYNKDSDVTFPSKPDQVISALFIHRPKVKFDKNMPKTYKEFLYCLSKNSKDQAQYVYYCLLRIKNFYEIIIRKGYSLNISPQFQNPVHTNDLPKITRRSKSNKVRLSSRVYWVTLLYLYKLLDYVGIINKKILNGEGIEHQIQSWVSSFGSEILIDLNVIGITGIDNRMTFYTPHDGKRILTIEKVPKTLFNLQDWSIKEKGIVKLIHPGPLVQLIIALETGLRHEHIQWLSTSFDELVEVIHPIDIDVFRLVVNTDKTKTESWFPIVSGRVINVLRSMRTFRDNIDAPAFCEDVYYHGNKNSKWGKFKPLFSYNDINGFPHSDKTYTKLWKNVLVAVQAVLNDLGVPAILYFKATSTTDIDTEVTPHSSRTTVVGEKISILPYDYVAEHITGHTPATIGYYYILNQDDFAKYTQIHRQNMSRIRRGEMSVDIGDGPAVIHAHTINSAAVMAMSEDPIQAMTDFGAVSTHFFDTKTGISILQSNVNLVLSFERTYICPYNRICPADQIKRGYQHRCNYCDYAIRLLDHLTAMSCERRSLIEESQHIEARMQSAKKLTSGELEALDKRYRIIMEDLTGLTLSMAQLELNRQQLTKEHAEGLGIHVYTPDIIAKNIESAPFPDMADDEISYIYHRIKELTVYPSLHTEKMKAIATWLTAALSNNTGGLLDWMKGTVPYDKTIPRLYGQIRGLMKIFGKSAEDIYRLAKASPDEIAKILNLPESLPNGLRDLLFSQRRGIKSSDVFEDSFPLLPDKQSNS